MQRISIRAGLVDVGCDQSMAVKSERSLSPRSYSVTFKAAGFTTAVHQGIELPAGFTGAVNADLAIGNPNETITVSGVVSSIDVRTNTQQAVVSSETQSKLASGTQDAKDVAKLT